MTHYDFAAEILTTQIKQAHIDQLGPEATWSPHNRQVISDQIDTALDTQAVAIKALAAALESLQQAISGVARSLNQ